MLDFIFGMYSELLSPFLDIGHWYALNRDLCPNCGWVLKDLHPMANLYPHFTGACKEMREKEYRAEIESAGSHT